MRRPTILAAALLIAAPLFAADAPKTQNPQTQTAAQEDSPLVAAAKAAAKARKGKAIVITNDTLAKSNGVAMTTTESQPAITLPAPDAALLAMQQNASPQAKSAQPGRPSPAEAERQRRLAQRASRAEDAGPYSDTPYLDEATMAAAQNPTNGTTQNPTYGTTQNPSYGTTQNPSYGQTQNPTTGQTQQSLEPKKP